MEESKQSTRFFALILLIMFVGLLGVGIVRYFDVGNSTMTRSHANCLSVGAGCGPLEHSLFHSFVVPVIIVFSIAVIFLALFSRSRSVVYAPSYTPEGPPPKLSIV